MKNDPLGVFQRLEEEKAKVKNIKEAINKQVAQLPKARRDFELMKAKKEKLILVKHSEDWELYLSKQGNISNYILFTVKPQCCHCLTDLTKEQGYFNNYIAWFIVNDLGSARLFCRSCYESYGNKNVGYLLVRHDFPLIQVCKLEKEKKGGD